MFPSIGFANPSAGGTAAITGSVLLTAQSPQAMSITPSAPGLYAMLPVATTMSKAVGLFSIYIAGDYDYGVKDSTGTQLGWIRARTGAVVGLSDNSTAAGVWATSGLENTGITAQYSNPTLANINFAPQRVTLDANRTAFLFGGTDCYIIAYDSSSQTWGTATLVRATVGSGAFTGILQTTNQILVCSCSSTTAFEAVTVTFSGTTPTVNSGTKATATLGGNISQFFQLIAVSTSFVISYGRATTTHAIRALTVSGTTPTIGGESTLQTSGQPSYPVYIFASGSIVRTLVTDSSATQLTCAPFTVSGSTLSAGTPAAVSFTGSGQFSRAFVNGNGNIVCQYLNTTHYATVFKLTSTTEAASSVSLGTVPTHIGYTDYVQVTASKTCFLSSASSSLCYANILTDSAGTASAGTEISTGESGTFSSSLASVTSSGTTANFVSKSTQRFVKYTFDCSGSSPVISAKAGAQFGAVGNVANPSPSDKFGNRFFLTLHTSAGSYFLSGGGSFDIGVTSNQYLISQKIAIPNFFGAQGGVIGAANNETWLGYCYDTNLNKGMFITRVEAAA